ncbi:hypothetical protein [Stackebrandtia albiflava]|nr:hypothetical protein [Stackebrandtia albiflava]
MTDSSAARLGHPGRYWNAVVPFPSRPEIPREPPDLTDAGTFAARAELRDPRWFVPGLLLALAVFAGWFSTVPGSGFPSTPETRRVVLIVLAIVLAVAAVAVWLWDVSTRREAIRSAHAAFLRRGFVVEAHVTPLNVGDESVQWAWLLLDTRLPGERRDHLYAAFDGWLADVSNDRDTHREVAAMVRAAGKVPGERLFGPEGAGAYLVGPLRRRDHHILLPSRREDRETAAVDRSWRIVPVRYT